MPYATNKKKIAASAVMLTASCALMAGLTFAWFTDSVANTGNAITAGSLSVALQQDPVNDGGAEAWTDVTETTPVFQDLAFEPGKSAAVNLRVLNKGSLATKYELRFASVQASKDIDRALEVYLDDVLLGTLGEIAANPAPLATGTIVPGEQAASLIGQLKILMPASHGNEYQDARVTFDLELVATQASHETDGFGSSAYDERAEYPGITTARTESEFKGALGSVEPGCTIKLGDDLTIKRTGTHEDDVYDTYIARADAAIDLNGRVLTVDRSSDPLGIAANNITVRSGTIAVLDRDRSAYPVFVTSGAQNAIFENVTFIGGIQVIGNSSATFRNCTFISSNRSSQHCLYLEYNSRATVEGCTFQTMNDGMHIYTAFASDTVAIEDCAFQDASGAAVEAKVAGKGTVNGL